MTSVPEGCRRDDVRMVALPFTHIADEMGVSKAANIVILGALLEATDMVETEQATAALGKLVKNDRYYEMDLRALERGREEASKVGVPVSDDYLWGV